MSWTPYLNDNPFEFSINNLPCLIQGKEHTGTSLFTICLLAKLHRQNHKLFILSGYPMARAEYVEQTADATNVLLENDDQVENALQAKTVFVLKENKDLFIRFVDLVSNDWIVTIKNIELFDESVYQSVKDVKNVLFSGDIDQCSFKKDVLSTNLQTEILFSNYEGSHISLPELPQYHGFLSSRERTGQVFLKQTL